MNGRVRLGWLLRWGKNGLEGWHRAEDSALLGTRSSAILTLAPCVGGNRSPCPLPRGALQPGGYPACEEQAEMSLEPPKWLQQNWCHLCLSPCCALGHQLCPGFPGRSHLRGFWGTGRLPPTVAITESRNVFPLLFQFVLFPHLRLLCVLWLPLHGL